MAESVFDNDIHPDIESQFSTADLVFAIQRVEVAVNTLNLTLAMGIGVTMLIAWKVAK